MEIADWHRGTRDEHGVLKLSSRRLLVLVSQLPATSAFKSTAEPPFGRGGDWTELEKMVAATHKELALNRASKYVGGENEYIPTVFLSPIERVEHFEQAQEDDEFSREATDEFEAMAFG